MNSLEWHAVETTSDTDAGFPMSRKRKGKNRKQPETGQLFERAERELSKGNVKGALKDAELCYRQQPAPERKELLERAYVKRVEQLQRMGLPAEAKAVLVRLMELQPQSPSIVGALPRLRITLGDAGVDSAAVFEEDPALQVKLADEAVLDPHVALGNHTSLSSQVTQIRDALAAVERGDVGAALAMLQGIPRGSPLGDWKLFVRGLAAFYGSDQGRTEENWRRLDTARPAYRIAQTLRVAAGELPADQAGFDVSGPLETLVTRLRGGPAQRLLRGLAKHWQKGDWDEFFAAYRRLCGRFGKTDAALIERVNDIVWKRAVRDGDEEMLERLVSTGPAPALDPHWNRARALMAEHPEEGDLDSAEHYWTGYVEDLGGLAALGLEERGIAAGLVLKRLAEHFAEFAEECEQPDIFRLPREDQAEACRQRAAHFFLESIRRCPRLVEAYRELAALHENMEEPRKAAAVLVRLLGRVPDDFEAHLWLANYYLGCDEPGKSEPHVKEVVRMKPRDERVVAMRWSQRVTMIRCLAKERQIHAARAEWEEAAKVVPPGVEPYTLDTLRAGIEFRGKNEEAAQRSVEDALSKAGEPTAVWLQMSCTAARFKLSGKIKKTFDNRFKEAIELKPVSRTAGQIARFLSGLKDLQINYTGRATQEKLFVKYLERGKRVAWEENDLADVCDLLWLVPKQRKLRDTLVFRGLTQFPGNPRFSLQAGVIEMDKGPFSCDVDTALSHMNRVLELIGQPGTPADERMVGRAQQAIGLLRDVKEDLAAPFGPFGYEDDYEDDEFEDDYEDDVGVGPVVDPLEFSRGGFVEDADEGDGPFGELGPADAARVLAEMEHSMPRAMMAQMRRVMAEAGMSPLEAIREILEGKGGPPGPPHGRRKKSRGKSRKK